MAGLLTNFLAEKGGEIAARLVDALGLAKAAPSSEDYSRIDQALDDIDFYDGWDDIRQPVENILAGVSVQASKDAVSEFGLFDPDLIDRVGATARGIAKDTAAEMVGMTRHGELLLPNPNPEWSIPQATRDMIREAVTKAWADGTTAPQLAAIVRGNHAFSPVRARTIARTEFRFVGTKARIAGWKAGGLVAGKKWVTHPGCCDPCHHINGQIVGLDDQFSVGVDPPLHPNCLCNVSPVLPEEMPDRLKTHEETHP